LVYNESFDDEIDHMIQLVNEIVYGSF
jgi:hypothetical protein